MTMLIISYLIYIQELKLKALEYFNDNNMKCNIEELNISKINYFSIDMNFLYGNHYNEKELKRDFFNSNSDLNKLTTINHKKKEYTMYLNQKLISFKKLFEKYNQIIFKRKYKIRFLAGSGDIYKYYSVLVDNKLNIIARFDWTECRGDGFNLSANEIIDNWFSKIISKKSLFKLDESQRDKVINFIFNQLKINKINLEKKDVKASIENNKWKVELFGKIKFLDQGGKLIISKTNSMKTYDSLKISFPRYNCGANKFLFF